MGRLEQCFDQHYSRGKHWGEELARRLTQKNQPHSRSLREKDGLDQPTAGRPPDQGTVRSGSTPPPPPPTALLPGAIRNACWRPILHECQDPILPPRRPPKPASPRLDETALPWNHPTWGTYVLCYICGTPAAQNAWKCRSCPVAAHHRCRRQAIKSSSPTNGGSGCCTLCVAENEENARLFHEKRERRLEM